jgi:EAL domain-containing protein (putative c-di-GMP-specific phosphodiesterase class I)/CheY-like chemotaxis protein
MSVEKVRVVVADDEETVLDVLRAILASEPGLELVGTATDAEGAIEIASRETPDVALVDVRMPGGGGSRAAREIAGLSPAPTVIALSADDDVGTVRSMLDAGASGYLVKDSPTNEILDAIRRSVDVALNEADPPTADVAQTYAEFVSRQARESRAWEHRRDRVRGLLHGDAIQIVYQPIFDLLDGSVAGMEALARFDVEPSLPPDTWFAEAEAVGLARDLEVAALHASLRAFAQIPPGAFLALNASPTFAVAPELRDAILGVPGERIVLEVTEHSPVADYEALSANLGALRELGVRVAIDDVGAGFASLRHVLRLDPDLIKLDMSLTHAIDTDDNRLALAAALISFASHIGADVVAEGVETTEELSALRDAGVGFAQGFLLALPEPMKRSTLSLSALELP